MKQKYVKVSDVAKMFGVSRQTICNWINKRFLEAITIDGWKYVSKKSLNAVSSHLKRISELEESVIGYEKRLSELERNYAESVKELRNCCNWNKALVRNRQVLARMLPAFIQIIQSTPNDNKRNAEILKMLLMGEDINSISTRFELTSSRVKQIIDDGLLDIEMNITNFLTMKAERDTLLEEVKIHRINELNLDKIRCEVKNMKDVTPSILTQEIVDCGLSVRAINCCRFGEITTIGDLVAHTEYSLLTIRNMGKKTLNELKDYLSSVGLELGKNYMVQPDGSVVEVTMPVQINR